MWCFSEEREESVMKCPKCGENLRQSKKNPDRLLCDNCRKGYWIDDLENDYEDDYEDALIKKRSKKPKKKMGVLKITGIVIGVLFVIGIIGSLFGDEDAKGNNDASVTADNASEAESINESIETEQTTQSMDENIPKEYSSALNKAQSYSEMMHMSKQGIYDQLTSEYGEQFSAEAAQYAVDNLNADYKINALEKAKEYQESMDMSPEAIRDQLTSEYGEKFTQEEADYAISNLQ